MLKLIGTVEKGQPVLVCVAGNLCSPEVFDQVKLPADMARLYVDYLGKEGPWDMDSLGWQLIDQLKKKCSGPIVLAGYSAGGVMWKYTRTADPEAAYTVSRSLREVDYREALKAYKNPALIIHGSLDTRRKMDSVTMIRQSLPQAETVLLQTGHTPMAEDVKGYGEALNRFLREKVMLQ